jgi:hypothetical protein
MLMPTTLIKRRKRPSGPSADTIQRALQSAKTNKKIAQELRVHKETVVAWRKKYGIPRFIPQEDCRDIIVRVLRQSPDGLYQADLVQHCGCSRQKIYWILRAMTAEGRVAASGETNARKWYLTREPRRKEA